MPFGTEGLEPGIGLALSGGGFRATLFHLGSIWRLNEVGLLGKLKRISSVSGGSITNGLLAVNWTKLDLQNGFAANYPQVVAAPLREFCKHNVDVAAIGEGALLPWKSATDIVQHYYDDLFDRKTLRDLPAEPRFVFNSTNFSTGVSFRFSRPYAGDYRIGLINNPEFKLSLAVAASSAFPPFLSPVIVDVDPGKFVKVEGADLFDDENNRRRLVLTDGGVYDNLGLETIWNRYDTLLVSDAGAPFPVDESPGAAWHKQALRAMDIATAQARALRKRALMGDYNSGQRKGTYWGIMVPIAKYAVPQSLPVSEEKTRELAGMRTRLNHFNDQEQGELINWGYAICDAALHRYMDITDPAPKWPVPEFPLS